MERLNPGNGDKTENDWNTPDSYSTLGTLTYLIYCFRKVLDTQRLLKNVDCKGWKKSEANRLVFIAATPTSISILDSYGMKTLWFEFGNDIFTGFKMLTA